MNNTTCRQLSSLPEDSPHGPLSVVETLEEDIPFGITQQPQRKKLPPLGRSDSQKDTSRTSTPTHYRILSPPDERIPFRILLLLLLSAAAQSFYGTVISLFLNLDARYGPVEVTRYWLCITGCTLMVSFVLPLPGTSRSPSFFFLRISGLDSVIAPYSKNAMLMSLVFCSAICAALGVYPFHHYRYGTLFFILLSLISQVCVTLQYSILNQYVLRCYDLVENACLPPTTPPLPRSTALTQAMLWRSIGTVMGAVLQCYLFFLSLTVSQVLQFTGVLFLLMISLVWRLPPLTPSVSTREEEVPPFCFSFSSPLSGAHVIHKENQEETASAGVEGQQKGSPLLCDSKRSLCSFLCGCSGHPTFGDVKRDGCHTSGAQSSIPDSVPVTERWERKDENNIKESPASLRKIEQQEANQSDKHSSAAEEDAVSPHTSTSTMNCKACTLHQTSGTTQEGLCSTIPSALFPSSSQNLSYFSGILLVVFLFTMCPESGAVYYHYLCSYGFPTWFYAAVTSVGFLGSAAAAVTFSRFVEYLSVRSRKQDSADLLWWNTLPYNAHRSVLSPRRAAIKTQQRNIDRFVLFLSIGIISFLLWHLCNLMFTCFFSAESFAEATRKHIGSPYWYWWYSAACSFAMGLFSRLSFLPIMCVAGELAPLAHLDMATEALGLVSGVGGWISALLTHVIVMALMRTWPDCSLADLLACTAIICGLFKLLLVPVVFCRSVHHSLFPLHEYDEVPLPTSHMVFPSSGIHHGGVARRSGPQDTQPDFYSVSHVTSYSSISERESVDQGESWERTCCHAEHVRAASGSPEESGFFLDEKGMPVVDTAEVEVRDNEVQWGNMVFDIPKHYESCTTSKF